MQTGTLTKLMRSLFRSWTLTGAGMALMLQAPAGAQESAPVPPADAQEIHSPVTRPEAAALTASGYAAQAEEVMEHIRNQFFDGKTGLYAASGTDRNPAFIWGSGIMFSAWAGAAAYDQRHRAGMDRFFKDLEVYWDHRAAIPGYEPGPAPQGGKDKYYDDNAWMVLTFLEAFEITGDERYRTRALAAHRFVMSGWDEQAGGGIWWHEGHNDDAKNTCVNAPAALSCFRLTGFDKPAEKEWMTGGQRLVDWTEKTLRAPNGLFSDHIKVSNGRVRRGQLSYNQALMLRAFLQLHRLTGAEEWRRKAEDLGLAAEALIRPSTGAWRDSLKWSHLMVEADLELYRLTGADYLWRRAVTDTAWHFSQWKARPHAELIINASMARQLWLMALHRRGEAPSPEGKVPGRPD